MKRTPSEQRKLNEDLGQRHDNKLTLFDGDRFCQGELPIGEHLASIRDLTLVHKGILAELHEHRDRVLKGGHRIARSVAIAIKGEERVIKLLSDAYEALSDWDSKYEDVCDRERCKHEYGPPLHTSTCRKCGEPRESQDSYPNPDRNEVE